MNTFSCITAAFEKTESDLLGREICFKKIEDILTDTAKKAGIEKFTDFDEIKPDDVLTVVFKATMPLVSSKTVKKAIDEFKKSDESFAFVSNNGKEVIYLIKGNAKRPLNGGFTINICSDCEDGEIKDNISYARVQKIMQKKINEYHMQNGIMLIDPDCTYIGLDVTIGENTVIYPNTILKGKTKIASNCEIGPSSTLDSSIVGDGTEVINSVVLGSEIAKNTSVGPFAYVRPGSKIGSEVKIGDFVEIKNSSIDDGTKVSHLTYVGDSDVGKNVNFGCGTVTVNYDGLNKHRTTIGDEAFIGCNTNLVAPVTVENNSFIAAGSTITNDVEAYSLAIARARQVDKKGWAKNAGWNTKKNK